MSGSAAPTSLVALIDRLADPPAPEPVSFAPQTAGWWILGVLLALALIWGLRRVWLRRRANAYRRAALVGLAQAGDDPAAIAAILRRAALAAFPRREVAGLIGSDWLDFLSTTGDFPQSAGPELIRAPYAPNDRAQGLRAAAESWVRTHRRGR